MNSYSELEKENLKTAEAENPQHLKQQEPVDKEQITLNYLQTNHDFFNRHPSLLATIEIPHDSGAAVSLVERQVGILREQNSQQKVHLAELVEIAKDNEQSNQRIHKLTLSLLDCTGIDACEVVLDERLCDDFSVDAVALRLFVEPIPEQPKYLFIYSGSSPDSRLASELEKLLNTRKPMCGFFKNLPLDELFEEKSATIASLAVLPLYVEKNHCFGALIIGSDNIRRFNADMGTLFLERLGETLSHVLHPFLKQKS